MKGMTSSSTHRHARVALAGCEAEYRRALDEAERLREQRDRAVLNASEAGVPVAELADMLGFKSPGRVSQIVAAARKARSQ